MTNVIKWPYKHNKQKLKSHKDPKPQDEVYPVQNTSPRNPQAMSLRRCMITLKGSPHYLVMIYKELQHSVEAFSLRNSSGIPAQKHLMGKNGTKDEYEYIENYINDPSYQ